MSLMRRGMTFLAAAQKKAAGYPVVYARGAVTATITAWPGEEQVETNPVGVRSRRDQTERDYLFAAADLVLGGTPTTPRKGDRITETVEGVTATYEVTPKGTEPAWRAADATGVMFRVHVRKVS